MENNFSNYSEGSLSDGVLDLQFNLLYMPINTETTDDSVAANNLDYEDEETTDEVDINGEDQSGEDDPADEQPNYEEPYVYTYNITTNIQIYDIPKNIKTFLFKSGELEEGSSINNIYFEQAYDSRNARMLFGTSIYNVRNNCNIIERDPKNRLLIEVSNNRKAENQLWLCDKWGFNKRCILRYSTSSELSWHLDMFNEVIRIMVFDGYGWNITEHEW